MFGLTLVGRPCPIAASELPANIPADYRELMSEWGPGCVPGILEVPDPREPAGLFRELQLRFRLHAAGQRAMSRWRLVDDELQAHGIVIARRCRLDSAWLASARGLVELEPTDASSSSIEQWVAQTLRRGPRTYCAGASRRTELYAALRDRDEAAADVCLPRIYTDESAWAMLQIAIELATSPALAELDAEARADLFDRSMRYAKRDEPDLVASVPVREIRDAIKARKLTPAHASALAALTEVEGVFHGPTSDIEREVGDQIIATPYDRGACEVLADHFETSGLAVRARLMRDQAGAVPLHQLGTPAFVVHNVDADEMLNRWSEAWRTDDPATSIDEQWAIVGAQPSQTRHALVAGIVYRNPQVLAQDPAATVAFATLGVRSKEVESCLSAIVHADKACSVRAAPWLLAAVRHPSFVDLRYVDGRRRTDGRHDLREDLANAFHTIGGKLTKGEVDEVLGWLDGEVRQRVAALCLLQKSGKDDRVLEACLARFTEGHPYTERAIAKRKTDARVLPALLAAFDRVEKTALVGGKIVHYSESYRILARYLATKLGNARGKAAWERCKLKGRIDRAESDREARREFE